LSARVARLLFFFFYHAAPLRHLPSFPTRRSSDLNHLARAIAGLAPLRQPLRKRITRGPRRQTEKIDAHRNRMSTPTRYVEPRSLDRKSTRLNSSHDQISYAVFCLKKKI